jgi:hypothetical protein
MMCIRSVYVIKEPVTRGLFLNSVFSVASVTVKCDGLFHILRILSIYRTFMTVLLRTWLFRVCSCSSL